MRLFELFTQTAKWQWEYESPEYKRASFIVGKIKYFVTFDELFLDKPAWEVVFVDQHGNANITGSGNAALVFSTVIDVMKTFKDDHRNVMIVLSAEEPSRIKLYNRIANKFSNNVKSEKHDDRVYFYIK